MHADPRIAALPDIHGHAKGEHKPFAEERPIPYTARMLFLWFYHACRRASPRFLMVADHVNYLTFEDPAAVNLVRRALKLAQAGDLYGAAETAGVEIGHAAAVSEGLRKGMRYSIGAEIDNDPRSRPDAQNIVDAMRPDGMIRSVHFLPIAHPQHGENWMWPFDNPEFAEFYEVVGTEAVWELYAATLFDAIEKLPGHIVGHFYVPAKFGHWPDEAKLESYEDRLVDACAERGMAIEINSRYFYKHYAGDEAQIERYRTAYLRLLRKARAKGVMIAVGSDAHSPKDQGGAFETVLALLDEADVNEIAFPINGRLARVALRATEEILRQHSAALASAAPVERAHESEPSAAPHESAEPVPVTAAETPTVARPRPKAKPRPAAAAAVAATPDGAGTDGVAEPVANAIAPAPTAPAPEKARPAKKRPASKKAAPEAPVAAGAPPGDGSLQPDTSTPAAPKPERAVAAEAPEPIVVAAERIVTAVADTAKRAASAIVEATTTLLAHKPSKRAASAPKPPAAKSPAKAAPSRAAAKPAGKPAPKKPPVKKAAPAKTAAKKAVPAKRVPAKKTAAAKKPAAKKAARAARPAAKKAATRSVARPAAKPVKKATTAKRGTPAKAAKRTPAPKRTAPKKAAPKKPVAKKKGARPRR